MQISPGVCPGDISNMVVKGPYGVERLHVDICHPSHIPCVQLRLGGLVAWCAGFDVAGTLDGPRWPRFRREGKHCASGWTSRRVPASTCNLVVRSRATRARPSSFRSCCGSSFSRWGRGVFRKVREVLPADNLLRSTRYRDPEMRQGHLRPICKMAAMECRCCHAYG